MKVYCTNCKRRFENKTGVCRCGSSSLRTIQKVTVRIRDGIVSCVDSTVPWIDTQVNDYDIEGASDDEISKDENGKECFLDIY